jgi:Subtilase family
MQVSPPLRNNRCRPDVLIEGDIGGSPSETHYNVIGWEVLVNRGVVRALSLLGIFALAACSSSSMSQSMFPQNASSSQDMAAMPPDALTGPASGDVPFIGPHPVRALCPNTGDPNRMRCFAWVRTDIQPTFQGAGRVQNDGGICPFYGEAYCPSDLQSAYKLPSAADGKDKVVAIVDAFGYKHAASDLAEYRREMGLKPCGEVTKCLRIVNQEGKPSPLPNQPSPSAGGWLGEESLDLDMVSAICPNCRIILVQTQSDYTSSLYTGVKTAAAIGAHYIGASWGGAESPANPIFHHAGVVITAAAGDNGGGGDYGGSRGGPEAPCSFPYVVCVGGTHLVRANNARGWSENVWNDFNFDQCGASGYLACGATGSGCSAKIAKPAWQDDGGCHMRSESDVSATASLRAPVAIYNSELGGGCPAHCFYAFGGTSASTQIISAVYALAGNAGIQNGAASIWHRHTDLFDVKIGNNLDGLLGVICDSGVKYICTARAGFDGPTGWGTPKGIAAF